MYRVNTDQVTEVTAPTVEPVTLAQAKAHMRITHSDDDTWITSRIIGARQWVENYLQRALVQHAYRADIPGFDSAILLPYGPVISITSITYWDTSSPQAQQTVSSSVYTLYGDVVVLTDGQTWPSISVRPNAVSINYTAGYASTSSPLAPAENVPQTVKDAILMMVASGHEQREDHVVGATFVNTGMVRDLLQPWRIYR